jgi:hypothetical protein
VQVMSATDWVIDTVNTKSIPVKSWQGELRQHLHGINSKHYSWSSSAKNRSWHIGSHQHYNHEGKGEMEMATDTLTRRQLERAEARLHTVFYKKEDQLRKKYGMSSNHDCEMRNRNREKILASGKVKVTAAHWKRAAALSKRNCGGLGTALIEILFEKEIKEQYKKDAADRKVYKAAKKKLDDAYEGVMDELILGDCTVALKLIGEFRNFKV